MWNEKCNKKKAQLHGQNTYDSAFHLWIKNNLKKINSLKRNSVRINENLCKKGEEEKNWKWKFLSTSN